VGCVAGIRRGQGMIAFRQGNDEGSLARGVEGGACCLGSAIADDYDAGCGTTIFAGNGHVEGSAGMAVLVEGVHGEGGLCRQPWSVFRGQSQSGNGERNTQCCNQLKPQTAAKKTCHVHLLR
jgi:hypothetical protein